MKRLLTSLLALVALVFVAGEARADGGFILGTLVCTKTGPGMTYVVYSRIPVNCSYSGVGGPGNYTGISGIGFGVDLEWEQQAAMAYLVVGGSGMNPGGLAGTYVGAKGSATLGVGPSAQAGLLGVGTGFELVPLGLGGQIGAGFTGGIAYLSVQAAGMMPARMPASYVVYFAFNSTALTPDAQKTIGAAAAAFKSGAGVHVQVVGYTDRAGSSAYNIRLSKRRADVVRAALVKDGVAAAAIADMGRGEDSPAVPTADGVRNPQNRRVTITLTP
jgi:hypothetical protein